MWSDDWQGTRASVVYRITQKSWARELMDWLSSADCPERSPAQRNLLSRQKDMGRISLPPHWPSCSSFKTWWVAGWTQVGSIWSIWFQWGWTNRFSTIYMGCVSMSVVFDNFDIMDTKEIKQYNIYNKSNIYKIHIIQLDPINQINQIISNHT